MHITLFKEFVDKLVTLEPGAWNDVLNVMRERRLKKKEHYLLQGEICQSIGFITQGYVRLYYILDGEDITKDFNFEQDFCGSHASFSQQQPSTFSIVAMEDVSLLEISHRDLNMLYDRYKSFERLGRLQMERMFNRKEQRESSFLQQDAEQRYAEMLKTFPGITQRVPLKYIASYLGMSAETLSRMRAIRER